MGASELAEAGRSVLIVIPTFNERDNLGSLIPLVHKVLPEASVLVVDDNSSDGTGELAERLAAVDPRISVLHRPQKLGLGTAYVDGFRWGLERDFLVFFEMDADFSHDPKYLPSFLKAIERGADVVSGSRNVRGGGVEGWGPGRHVLSKGGSMYSRWILGVRVRDLTTGYKAYTRGTLEKIGIDSVRSNGYAFQIEMTYRALEAGLSVEEVPIVFVDRRAGKSKMSRKVFLEAVAVVWKLRFARH